MRIMKNLRNKQNKAFDFIKSIFVEDKTEDIGDREPWKSK